MMVCKKVCYADDDDDDDTGMYGWHTYTRRGTCPSTASWVRCYASAFKGIRWLCMFVGRASPSIQPKLRGFVLPARREKRLQGGRYARRMRTSTRTPSYSASSTAWWGTNMPSSFPDFFSRAADTKLQDKNNDGPVVAVRMIMRHFKGASCWGKVESPEGWRWKWCSRCHLQPGFGSPILAFCNKTWGTFHFWKAMQGWNLENWQVNRPVSARQWIAMFANSKKGMSTHTCVGA